MWIALNDWTLLSNTNLGSCFGEPNRISICRLWLYANDWSGAPKEEYRLEAYPQFDIVHEPMMFDGFYRNGETPPVLSPSASAFNAPHPAN